MSGVRDRQAEWFRGPHRVELIVLCEMQWRVVNVHWDRRLIYATSGFPARRSAWETRATMPIPPPCIY